MNEDKFAHSEWSMTSFILLVREIKYDMVCRDIHLHNIYKWKIWITKSNIQLILFYDNNEAQINVEPFEVVAEFLTNIYLKDCVLKVIQITQTKHLKKYYGRY